MKDVRSLKYAAAARALEFVEPGMKLGLGSGTTSAAFVELLGVKVRNGLDVICTSTSEVITQKARGLDISLAALSDLAPLDLAIDGADEADADLNLIKGGGGALTREKIVEASSRRLIIIADESKWVEMLGRFPLPVEVVAFGHKTTQARIEHAVADLGYDGVAIELRQHDGTPFKTDGGNVIYDCRFGAIADCRKLAAVLSAIPGVVEHGLFIDMAEALVLARPGGIEVIRPQGR
jgi:ribose 5-phosphate isomerase A